MQGPPLHTVMHEPMQEILLSFFILFFLSNAGVKELGPN